MTEPYPPVDRQIGEPIEGEVFTELTELREIACTPLSVVVDFNELLHDLGETDAYRIVTQLKDLLA